MQVGWEETHLWGLERHEGAGQGAALYHGLPQDGWQRVYWAVKQYAQVRR